MPTPTRHPAARKARARDLMPQKILRKAFRFRRMTWNVAWPKCRKNSKNPAGRFTKRWGDLVHCHQNFINIPLPFWYGAGMSTENLTPQVQDILLHDILPGERQEVPPHKIFHLKERYPNSFRLTLREEEPHAVNIDEIDTDKPMSLIRVPSSSKWVRALDADPLLQHQKLHIALRDECGLKPEKQFLIMSVYPRADGSNLVTGNPDSFLLSINDDNFYELAMDMLRKLADPRIGSQFAHDGDAKQYEADLGNPKSHTSQLIAHIIANAKPSANELDELRNSAARKQNFEFCARLMDIGDTMYPGFKAARSRKPSSLAGGQGKGNSLSP